MRRPLRPGRGGLGSLSHPSGTVPSQAFDRWLGTSLPLGVIFLQPGIDEPVCGVTGRPLVIKPLGHYFLHLDVLSRVFCHLVQIRIHCFGTGGKKLPVILPAAGGAPIDPAVFGYIRVSQAEGESGLATQRRILNDSGLRDDRIFTDVASGRNMRRPSWTELRGMLNPGDTVVVPRLDRLARTSGKGSKRSRSFPTRASTSAPWRRGWTRATTTPPPASCSTCCFPWRNGRGTPSGTGSGPAWTAPRWRGESGEGLRRCRQKR